MLPAFDKNLPENRLGLARWLVAPTNPLAARVLVNRYWAMLFGTGLVATPEDFGNQGTLPTHPALLDYLAVSFRDGGWNLKGLLRQIVPVADLPAVVGRHGAGARDRPGQREARAWSGVPAVVRADPRQRAGRERAAGAHHRRPERVPLSAAGAVGGTGDAQRDHLHAGQGRRPLPPQPLHGVEAHHAAAVGDQLRRVGAPAVHREAAAHEHAAAGAGAAQRPAVRRGVARAGRAPAARGWRDDRRADHRRLSAAHEPGPEADRAGDGADAVRAGAGRVSRATSPPRRRWPGPARSRRRARSTRSTLPPGRSSRVRS